MTARLTIGTSARERMRRLAVVFAVELRLKIVAELYMREMSGKQFFEEFGGGSLSRVDQNFKTLATDDWLTRIRTEGPGGSRRGAEEHFYRALEPAYFDSETWGLMPYSIRVASTWNIVRQVAPRLRHALERSLQPAHDVLDLSCSELELDEEGWQRAIDAVAAHFVRVFDEQQNARDRAQHSGESLVRTDVFSFAFESPTDDAAEAGGHLLQAVGEPLASFVERLAPILRDEVRLLIVSECNRREVSVTQFHREFGGASKSAIGRRFKSLEQGGFIAKGRKRTGGARRGAVEQFYRATRPAIPQFDPCACPPESLRSSPGWRAFEDLSHRVKESMLSGIFDARVNRCVNWSFVSLDRRGRENVIRETEELMSLIAEEEARSRARIAKSGTESIRLTLALAVLEASKDASKAP